ncbi:hypothetical protein BKA62DRAFT_695106 [Auriculariales sp. MPI-PUGE-AT-0066]|nr:hypothetical protein BKA62DRAFT_695106 [Auriculariales sp. MPI-PUGE-AT-0066]
MSLKLKSLCSDISPAILEALSNIAVKTAHGLLITHTALEIYQALPSDLGLSLEDIEDLRADVGLKLSSSGSSGAQLPTRNSLSELTVGVDALDELLRGLRAGDILEVAGQQGCGKTTLAMTIVARELVTSPTTCALWLDPNLSFLAKSFKRLLATQTDDITPLSRLHLADCSSISVAHDILDLIDSSSIPNIQLLVIDSFSDLYQSAINGRHSEGAAPVIELVKRIAELARLKEFRVILINGSTVPREPGNRGTHSAFQGTKSYPGLRSVLSHYTTATVWLNSVSEAFGAAPARVESEDLLVVELLRSNVSLAGRWCFLKLDSKSCFRSVSAEELAPDKGFGGVVAASDRSHLADEVNVDGYDG